MYDAPVFRAVQHASRRRFTAALIGARRSDKKSANRSVRIPVRIFFFSLFLFSRLLPEEMHDLTQIIRLTVVRKKNRRPIELFHRRHYRRRMARKTSVVIRDTLRYMRDAPRHGAKVTRRTGKVVENKFYFLVLSLPETRRDDRLLMRNRRPRFQSLL